MHTSGATSDKGQARWPTAPLGGSPAIALAMAAGRLVRTTGDPLRNPPADPRPPGRGRHRGACGPTAAPYTRKRSKTAASPSPRTSETRRSRPPAPVSAGRQRRPALGGGGRRRRVNEFVRGPIATPPSAGSRFAARDVGVDPPPCGRRRGSGHPEIPIGALGQTGAQPSTKRAHPIGRVQSVTTNAPGPTARTTQIIADNSVRGAVSPRLQGSTCRRRTRQHPCAAGSDGIRCVDHGAVGMTRAAAQHRRRECLGRAPQLPARQKARDQQTTPQWQSSPSGAAGGEGR